jgi:monofunctional glycosyltransferase
MSRRVNLPRLLKRSLLLVLALFLGYQLWIGAHLLVWKWVNPSQTHFMTLRLKELRQQNPGVELKQQWVDYAHISANLKRAVVAAEDDRFMQHHGVDWRGIEQAFVKNQRKGKSVAGGSSISQQLAKNLFLSPSRSYFRKGEELLIALMMELLWDKRRILEVYLNVVEWGNGVYGAEAAARRYYGTSAANLSPTQAAHMAVMLPSPRRYEKSYPAWVATHARRVQARMRYSQIP